MCVQKDEATSKVDTLIIVLQKLQESIDRLISQLPAQNGNRG